ncbi:alpha/beta hydrolase [Halosimplex rubrum]|uniref:Alpha/beta hydrolase n=1 Tax=Halosimplex rubrum TaxID=869889 RepID=A0A7D5PC12_9EURY|nr:alpha/beta hydrolase [Halosimplex rubrum]QLH79480.1 alpha/beta hydrolase [Halosimplex rubrum]
MASEGLLRPETDDDDDGPRLATDEPHPDVQSVLRSRRWLRPVALSTLGARGARLLAKLGLWLQDDDPPAVGDVTDLTVPGPDGAIPVRRYRPARSGPYPTVVFYHGGGFVLGDLESHDHLCRRLTVESGCEVVAVDYRLAPEYPFPKPVEDAYAALEWAADDPPALDGDGGLAVAGDSAGGNLAAVAALMAAERGGPALDYQSLVYPAVGTREEQASMREYAGYVLTEDDLRWFDRCYYGGEIHRRNPYADPSRACDLSGVPPATVVTAGFDPLRDGGIAYARQLVGDGVSVRFRNYPDMVHGFVGMLSESEGVARAHEAVADIGADLRTALDRA